MTILRVLLLGLLCLGFAACKGGGSSGKTGAQAVEEDLAQFRTKSVSGFDVDQQYGSAFSRLFQGDDVDAVMGFIRKRDRHVMTDAEAGAVSADFYENGALVFSKTLGEQFGFGKEKNSDNSFVIGMNYGSELYDILAAHPELGIVLKFPGGDEKLTTPRIGFIGLSKYYTILPSTDGKQYTIPLEGRIAVLVHEGRHSDCPAGKPDDCGYAHMACPAGSDLEGEFACDERPWGSYGVEAIFLLAVQDNYTLDSVDGQIMQFLSDDIISRIDDASWQQMTQVDPDLSSI